MFKTISRLIKLGKALSKVELDGQHLMFFIKEGKKGKFVTKRANAATRDQVLVPCARCGKIMQLSRTSPTDEKVYCSECYEKKAWQKIRQMKRDRL